MEAPAHESHTLPFWTEMSVGWVHCVLLKLKPGFPRRLLQLNTFGSPSRSAGVLQMAPCAQRRGGSGPLEAWPRHHPLASSLLPTQAWERSLPDSYQRTSADRSNVPGAVGKARTRGLPSSSYAPLSPQLTLCSWISSCSPPILPRVNLALEIKTKLL